MVKIVEAYNVSKKYRISHEVQAPYDTIVEAISRTIKKGLSRLSHPFEKSVPQVQYEDFWALQGIDLSIEEGDRVGIIGSNGAGKSTLLKIFSRITEPTSGRITIRGRVSTLLEVGTGFHPELTGRENIFLNGAILGMRHREIRQKFDEIVAFAEVEKFLDTPVKRYSSGMYTRLGFAIAAHLDPDLFIVDEVLAVGDAQFQSKCLKKLSDLSSHGRTILFVSHDVGSLLTLCNKGIFLEKGRMRMTGKIDHCISAYMQTFRSQALTWTGNVGDENIRIYGAAFTERPTLEQFFYQGDKIDLAIDYEVFKPVQDMVLRIGIWNQRNQLLAYSHTSDDVDHFQRYIQKGRHQMVFPLDTSIFHEGEYFLKVDCFIHNKKRIINDEVVLKLPIYLKKKNTHFTHAVERDGISLGNQWKMKAK